jgi:glutamyl-tRNA synthetase
VAWDAASIGEAVAGWADANGVKRKVAQAPIRVAVTGRTVGPPLWESLEVLGRDETCRRIRTARARLGAP